MSRPRDDEGMVLVWVALMLTVLLGFGAIVIDFGVIHRERRELQNGSDAAALAVAKDCASGACGGTAGGTAQSYANSNAHDGASTVTEVCGSGGGLGACAVNPPGTTGADGWVKVSTKTSAGGGDQVKLLLAPIVGAIAGKTVTADAAAAWGAAKSADTPPLAIAQCAYDSVVSGPLPSPALTLYFHDPTKELYGEQCADSPSGGFGWIQTSNCTATVTAGGTVGSDPGNNATQGCFRGWKDSSGKYAPGDVVPVGIFNAYSGNGSNATYQLVGIAAFRIDRYTFPSSENPKGFKCPITNENSCLQGRFEQLVTIGEFGGGTNFGVSVIKMID